MPTDADSHTGALYYKNAQTPVLWMRSDDGRALAEDLALRDSKSMRPLQLKSIPGATVIPLPDAYAGQPALTSSMGPVSQRYRNATYNSWLQSLQLSCNMRTHVWFMCQVMRFLTDMHGTGNLQVRHPLGGKTVFLSLSYSKHQVFLTRDNLCCPSRLFSKLQQVKLHTERHLPCQQPVG